ncbi:MAG TPA: hypothetical protein PKY82_14895 [Pyrinomonadaceae bacterium]|nr:hypothetical protein [Pyrinomonadaceae bacterium]
MHNLNNQKNNLSSRLCLIPLGIAVLFAMLMLFFAIISTEKAREHFQAKKTQGNIQQMAQKIRETPMMPVFPNDKTLTPTPIPTPTPQKSLLKQMEYYETGYLIMVAPLLVFGLQMAGLTLGFYQPKLKTYLKIPMKLRKSLFAMLTSFTLTPAILILYIWALRVGLIG